MSHNKILSYPRSGNHLIRFLVEFLTSKPTKGSQNSPKDVPICFNTFPDPSVLEHVNREANFSFEKVHFSHLISTPPQHN